MERTVNPKVKDCMRKLPLTTLCLAVTLTFAGCANDGPNTPAGPTPASTGAYGVTMASDRPDATTSAANQTLQQAQQLHAEASRAGFAWVATGQQIQAAADALDRNDMQAALAAATQALALATASVAQAEREANAWQTRAPFTDDTL